MKSKRIAVGGFVGWLILTGCASMHHASLFSGSEITSFKVKAQQEMIRRHFQLDSSSEVIFEVEQSNSVVVFVPFVPDTDRLPLGKVKAFQWFRFVAQEKTLTPTIENFRSGREFRIEETGIKIWGTEPIILKLESATDK